jgi:serine/threonine protein phosphatase PrpC
LSLFERIAQDEQARIVAAGGNVAQLYGVWRVNGVLSVSRSIGDGHMKARECKCDVNNTYAAQRLVISEPDTSTVELVGREEFVILACDGLWDVLSHEQVCIYESSSHVFHLHRRSIL